jgi:hypothetical protein
MLLPHHPQRAAQQQGAKMGSAVFQLVGRERHIVNFDSELVCASHILPIWQCST